MNADRPQPDQGWPADDPLLDACLDEVIGGRAPPDLTARILRTLQQRRDSQPTAVPASKVGEASGRRQGRQAALAAWIGVAAAACLLLGGAFAASFAMRGKRLSSENAASSVVRSSQQTGDENASQVPEKRPPQAPADPTSGNRDSEKPQIARDAARRGFDESPPFVAPEGSGIGGSPPASSDYAQPKPRPDDDTDVIAFIDRALRESWQAAGVAPSPPATDGEWARRTYLRILGRIPTYEELTAFLESRSSGKKQELVNRLLFDDEYVEQYARHWSGVWTNLLIGRSCGTAPDDLAHRAGLEQYLRRSLQFNKPYDQMVFELISATGSNRPGTEGYNGAVNFLLGNYTHNHTLATSKTARVFLGKQLHCAQCHNHPFESWTQDDFWGLNAFFHQANVVRDADKVRLTNRDFPGETGDIDRAEIYYDRLNGLRKAAYPRYLDGSEVNPHGEVAQVDRRRALGSYLAESRDLSRALVNRLWKHFLGYGFVEPVDDMRPGNPASHPALLEYLAEQFIAHDHDVKRLVRWIALTETFSLSSRIAPRNRADSPEQGAAPLFSRYYTRQAGAEEMYDSLALLAAGGNRASAVFAEFQAGRQAWLAQFTLDLETDEGDEANTFNGTIPQSLAMLNGEIVKKTIDSPHGVLQRLARSNAQPNEKLERLFLSALARKPTQREIEAANRLIAEHHGDVSAALEDLWWALLNSNEFILDH